MRRRSRFPELLLLAFVLVLLALLVSPLRHEPLPAPHPRPATSAGAQSTAIPHDPAVQPSVTEAASLFVSYRPPARQPRTPVAPPERVPWLHFIAYVVGSNDQTIYFFKNDQTGRVFMLSYNQPHEGWNLTSIQGDAYILEKDDHRYVVMKK